ncbi:unnamed protein product [Adineta steineri]|uniref:G-protein coupled receptors family 1 profile domain-containing protein n=1 Tax=Adineta steineri TaxID=433720 RepID=A0A818JWZ2_9BILA|nr:unnamed protein product [Adineta steineri]CAF3551917.1 unnamed protein product [Adineta steineri]
MTTYFDETISDSNHLNFLHYQNSSLLLTNDTTLITINYLNWPVLILSILAVFGTLGNLLVCASISLDKQLQTVTNWFLFSLAIADCLVSLVVIPLSIIKDLQGSWKLPIILCNLYVFLDVLLCTTSIWHLTILSINRFLHISRPFRSRERSKCKTFLTIVLIWTFSIAISCTILILGFTDKNNILIIYNENKQFCALNNRKFIIYGSIVCFCVPCILMLVTYSLTIRRLQQEAAKCYSDPDEHVVMMTQASDRLRRHRSCSKIRTSSQQYHQSTSLKDLHQSPSISTTSTSRSQTMIDVDEKLKWPITSTLPASNRQQRSFLHNTFVQKAVHVFKNGIETTSERRAMTVLGIVFFVFLVAWLPFSILNILSAVCPSCNVQTSLLNLTSWLGYIASNINPLIYTAFNVRFRRAFVSILTCQLNYFSHKRKGNNLYIFIASNNNQKQMCIDQQQQQQQQQYYYSIRRFASKRNSFA